MQENITKLINATYQLLELFPDGEPLKNVAKQRVLLIMEKLALGAGDTGLADDIVVLESYLELAKSQGWVMGINFLIVKKEWETIKKGMGVVKLVIPQLKEKQDNEIFVNKLRHKGSAPGGEVLLNGRQKSIVSLLAKRQKTQVKDIIQKMPAVTKRTIRRDLDDLMKKGKIRRVGEFNQVFYQIS